MVDVPKKRVEGAHSYKKNGFFESPYYATINPPSPTRERRAKAQIQDAMKSKDVDLMWKHWMDMDGLPISNLELNKVAKKLTLVLTKRLKKAIESEDTDLLQKAVDDADGKLQILKLGGASELRKAKQMLGMDVESTPSPVAISKPRTPESSVPRPAAPKPQKVQPQSRPAAAQSVSRSTPSKPQPTKGGYISGLMTADSSARKSFKKAPKHADNASPASKVSTEAALEEEDEEARSEIEEEEEEAEEEEVDEDEETEGEDEEYGESF